MSTQKMNYEGELFFGTAGDTAATRLENSRGITLSLEARTGNTSVRGDSSAPPIDTEQVTRRVIGIEFTMLNDSSDTQLALIRQACANGTPIALRGKDYALGKGPNMDVNVLTVSNPMPWDDGEQVVSITTSPNRSLREPQGYV